MPTTINTLHSSYAPSKSASTELIPAEKHKVTQALKAVGQSSATAPIVAQDLGESDFAPMAQLANRIYDWSDAEGAYFEQQEYQEVKAVLQQLHAQNPDLLNALPPQQHNVLQKLLTAANFCTNPVVTLLDQLPWHQLDSKAGTAGSLLKLLTRAARLGPIAKKLKLPQAVHNTLSPVQAAGKAANLTIDGSVSMLCTLPANLVGNIFITTLSMVDLAQRIIAARELMDSATVPPGEVSESVQKYIYVLENEYQHQLISSLGMPGLIYAVGSKLAISWEGRHNNILFPANPMRQVTPRDRLSTILLAAARNEAHPERDLATCAIAMIMGYGNPEVGGRKAGAVIRTQDFISAREALKRYFPPNASDQPGALDMYKDPDLLNAGMLLHGLQ